MMDHTLIEPVKSKPSQYINNVYEVVPFISIPVFLELFFCSNQHYAINAED